MRKIVLLLLLAGPAVAVASNAPPVVPVGQSVRAWSELQKSGNASVAAPRPMSGEVADKVYERYLNSFANPIPDSFEREKFVSGGGGR